MRYDDIYRMDEIKSIVSYYTLSFTYFVVSQNTLFFIFWMTAIFTRHHGAPSRRTISRDKTRSSFLNEGLHL